MQGRWPGLAMFTHLIENYKDEDYFSSDTDEKVDRLVMFAYVGNTAMQQSVPIGGGSRSGSSESSGEAPPPFVDLTGGPLERAEKSSDLDKTIVMTDEPAVMDVSELEMARVWEERPVSETLTGSKKKNSKLRRKARWEGAAEPSTSMPRVSGQKETVLQEALDEIAREQA